MRVHLGYRSGADARCFGDEPNENICFLCNAESNQSLTKLTNMAEPFRNNILFIAASYCIKDCPSAGRTRSGSRSGSGSVNIAKYETKSIIFVILKSRLTGEILSDINRDVRLGQADVLLLAPSKNAV